MKQSFIFTFFFFLGVGSAFTQVSPYSLQQVTSTGANTSVKVFLDNGAQISNNLTVDTIIVTKGVNIANSLKVDTLTVNKNMALLNNLKINKDLGVDSIVVTRGVKINNSLTVDSINVNKLNFSNSLNLNGGNLNLGNFTGNSNFILRSNNTSGMGATMGFYHGNGISSGTNMPDAGITKMVGSPLALTTIGLQNIVFRTAGTDFTNGINRVVIAGNGNVGMGIDLPTEKLNIAGNVKISGSEPTYKAEGSYPTIDLDGGTNTYPRIHFSGADVAGNPAKNFTTLTGEGGGFRIKTSGALTSELLGTQASTTTKQLHVYLAENWSGWAEIASKGLYGGAAYANAIDFTAGTRLKIDQNQYTGGLLMGYSNSAYPLRSSYVASAIKSQYMGSEINTVGQHKFDMVFGINSDGNGGFSFDPTERMRIKDDGTVKIGKGLAINTNIPLSGDTRLLVDGRIVSTNVTVALVSNWPDYVFEKSYTLTPLSKVEQFIEKNGHLPNVPSAAEVKKEGIDVGAMNAKLLEKVEELTLYIINQQKQIDELKKEMKNMKKQ